MVFLGFNKAESSKIELLKSKVLRQFIKYSIVGISNAIIGFGTMFILYNLFNFNYIVANSCGYVLGLINSFIWNKRWTFKSGKHYSKEIVQFVVVFIISYLSNLAFLIIFVEFFNINQNIAFVLSSTIYVLVGFTANRLWTFS